ncbi:unnamed protein product [Schistosoma margrebowiei]|uniref:Uncharacterized protein n=1 Tax=Schistosoma margrebowiei TaxID=48269 RepID=A0A3P8A726_9TREM|nr:unnamed protein product [Schistosoma margrebowiei]
MKLTKQNQEYENEIIKIKSNLEQVINKRTKELEECQLTNKQIELKLTNECKMKGNLEKQLVKLSNEMERMRNDYENLSKQAKESFFFLFVFILFYTYMKIDSHYNYLISISPILY